MAGLAVGLRYAGGGGPRWVGHSRRGDVYWAKEVVSAWGVLGVWTVQMNTTQAYIAVEGVIGVGKTTLARMFQKEIDAQLVLEVFEENPFLTDFYTDRARYAFQTQIFFLLSRYHQQRQLATISRPLISDYMFDKDRLFAQVNLERR